MSNTVVITGGTRGIGFATAYLFAQNKWKVVVMYHEHDEIIDHVIALLDKHSPWAASWRVDVADQAKAQKAILEVVSEFGGIDVLVNNAGVSWYGTFQHMPHEEMRRIMDVNFMGTAYCSQAVLPSMIERGSGVIVNVSSMWGVHGGSCEVMYSASKAAVIGFTKALAKEVGPAGIRVNCVAPGPIMTNMMRSFDDDILDNMIEDIPLGLIGAPFDIANAIWFLSTDESRYMTGAVLDVNGGMYT